MNEKKSKRRIQIRDLQKQEIEEKQEILMPLIQKTTDNEPNDHTSNFMGAQDRAGKRASLNKRVPGRG